MLHWIVIILLVLIFASVPVAAALGILSLSLDQLYMNGRLGRAIGEFHRGAGQDVCDCGGVWFR